MLDTMTSWFSVSDALTRVAVMVCVVCVTGGQLGAVQGPVKTGSFKGVESIRVIQCDAEGNDAIGVKISERTNESKALAFAVDRKSELSCTTYSSFTACTIQRGRFSKTISVRVILTDLEPGEVREYTCAINRDIGDGIGTVRPQYHHINVKRPEATATTTEPCPTTLASADQCSSTAAYIAGGVVAGGVVVAVVVVLVVVILVRKYLGRRLNERPQQHEENHYTYVDAYELLPQRDLGPGRRLNERPRQHEENPDTNTDANEPLRQRDPGQGRRLNESPRQHGENSYTYTDAHEPFRQRDPGPATEQSAGEISDHESVPGYEWKSSNAVSDTESLHPSYGISGRDSESDIERYLSNSVPTGASGF